MMKRRDILQRQAAQTNNPNTWRAFKDIRNTINNRLRYEERVWKQKRLSEVKGDSGKSWKVIKNILNWKSSEAPTKLFYKGTLRTKSQDIADSQNESFISKIVNIKKEIGQPRYDPLKVLKSLMSNRK